MLLSLMLSTAALSQAQGVSCTAALRGTTIALSAGLTVTVKQQGEVLKLKTDNRQDSLPTYPCRSEGGQEFVPVKIMDFNFDGVNDIAVLDGIGYGGVNVYYRLYFVGKDSNVLRESRAEPVGMNNLVIDAKSRTLHYSQKSGPDWVLTTLCLLPSGEDLFRCRETALNPKARAADDWDYTWYDPQGKALLTRPAKVGKTYAPEMFTVVRQAFFSAQPGAKVGRAYVIPGDRVEVLELRGDWAYATYKGSNGQVTVGWLARRVLR